MLSRKILTILQVSFSYGNKTTNLIFPLLKAIGTKEKFVIMLYELSI